MKIIFTHFRFQWSVQWCILAEKHCSLNPKCLFASDWFHFCTGRHVSIIMMILFAISFVDFHIFFKKIDTLQYLKPENWDLRRCDIIIAISKKKWIRIYANHDNRTLSFSLFRLQFNLIFTHSFSMRLFLFIHHANHVFHTDRSHT